MKKIFPFKSIAKKLSDVNTSNHPQRGDPAEDSGSRSLLINLTMAEPVHLPVEPATLQSWAVPSLRAANPHA